MRFGRLMSAAAVMVLLLVGGLYALAPAAHGQSRVKIVGRGGDDPAIEVLTGGSEIGIAVRDVDQADVSREKLAGPAGAVVEEVRTNTPAAKAGLKAGDVITTFDGERVRSARQLERLVGETPAGRSVKLSVMRGGAKVDLDIAPEAARFAGGTLGDHVMRFDGSRVRPELMPRVNPDMRELPGFPAFNFNWDGDGFGMLMGRGRLGVQIEPVSDQLAKYFGVDAGVLVRSVTDDSPAAKAGLKAGDVITAVDGRAVKDQEDLRNQVRDVPDGKDVTLTVTRDRKPLSIKVTPESPERQTQRRTRRTV